MDEIIKANKELGKKEAEFYDHIHSEIFNKKEQKRLNWWLDSVTAKITSNGKRALDIGAGTGNMTMKLLKRGFEVVALDLCPEYLKVLKKKAKKYYDAGKLHLISKGIDDANFKKECFDFVCCYSTLHHLPSYTNAVKTMTDLVKEGGIIYIDHETCTKYWYRSKRMNHIYDLSCGALNAFYVYVLKGIKRSSIQFDYSMADYHTTEEDHIDSYAVKNILKNKMKLVSMKNYMSYRTHLLNPFRSFYKLLYKTDMVMLIAKK